MESFTHIVAFFDRVVLSARENKIGASLVASLDDIAGQMRAPPTVDTPSAAVERLDAALDACRELIEQYNKKAWLGKLVKRRTKKSVRCESRAARNSSPFRSHSDAAEIRESSHE